MVSRGRHRGLHQKNGQTASEYMLVLSVLVIAVVAACYTFVPIFQAGVSRLAGDVSTILASGRIGGIGLDRGSGTNGLPGLVNAVRSSRVFNSPSPPSASNPSNSASGPLGKPQPPVPLVGGGPTTPITGGGPSAARN